MLAVLFIVLVVCIYAMTRGNKKRPPTAGGAWPIVGHTFMVLRNPIELYKIILKLSMDCLKQGGVTILRVVIADVYIIADPTHANHVLNSCLEKDVIYDYFKPWIGEGLISATELIWRRHRKLLGPTFHQGVLDSYLSELNKQARCLVLNLEPEVGKGKFDHGPYIEHATLHMICSTAMGVAIDEKDLELREKYLQAKNEFEAGLIRRAQTFWLHNEIIYSLSYLKRKQEELANTLHELTNAIIEKRKAEMSENEVQNEMRFKPFMELLLNMEKDGILTRREVQEEVDTFMFAGSDTISVTFTVALLVIGSYPDVQRKIAEELQEVFHGNDRDVEKQDLVQLKYLEAVIKECLRLFPSVSLVGRKLDKDINIENFTLPSGSRCLISLYGVNRHSSWGADAEQFRPERWLESALPSQPQLASFGYGKRKCIGYTFAIMCMKTILAHILRQYRVWGDVKQLVQRIEVVSRPVSKEYLVIKKRGKILNN